MGVRTFNRFAVILKKKQPFLDWYKKLPDSDSDVTLEDLNEDPFVCLLPEFEEEEDMENCVEDNCDFIFELQMDEWWQGEDKWEKSLNWEKFNLWFDFSICTVPLDLADEPLVFED